MRKLIAAALPLALALASCAPMEDDPYDHSGYPPSPYPDPYPPYPQPGPYPEPYPPQPNPTPPVSWDYRAIGTEPFWDLTIGREMIFTDRGTGLTITQPTPAPINGTAGPIYRTQRLEVNIVHSPCSDGMSDRSYPDTVQVYADRRLYRGCGGAATDPITPMPPDAGPPAPPLDRTRWRVVAINNRPVPPGDYSMEFDGGRLSARFGCNGIGASYTQTGSTLDAGPVTATRMACPDMSWETQGIAIVDQVMQVRALDPNRITLSSRTGTIELVRQ